MARGVPGWVLRHVFVAMVLALIVGLPIWAYFLRSMIGMIFFVLSLLPSSINLTVSRNKASLIVRPCPTIGVKKVILRAACAETCKVISDPDVERIEIQGLPAGGAKGYHPIDRNWRETPPSKWGLEFVYKKFGDALVISTEAEIHYIHHDYALIDLELSVPPGVTVVREKRELDGDGKANLDPPSP